MRFLILFTVSMFSFSAVAEVAQPVEESIVNHGPSVMSVVVEGAPGKNVARANALPASRSDWQSMSRWKRPKVVTARLVHSDGVASLAQFEYQLVLLYGGAPVGTSGAYIGHVSVLARDITIVRSGGTHSLNSEILVKAVRNKGTIAEPVAEIDLELRSVLLSRDEEGRVSRDVQKVLYRVDGEGNVKRVHAHSSRVFDPLDAPASVHVVNENLFPSSVQAQAACPNPVGGVSLHSLIDMLSGAVFPLVSENRILNNGNAAMAAALPQGVRCWNQLRDWKQETRGFEYRWSNTLWWDFVAKGEVVWLAGAQDRRGKGRYIGFVTVQMKEISRGISRSVNIDATAPPQMITNIGTVQDPISSVTIMMHSKMRNLGKVEVANWLVSVDGHGNISDVSREAEAL